MNAINEIAGLLKLNREVEGRRDVDALDFNALRVRLAGSDLIRPEAEAIGIRFAIKKIEVEWRKIIEKL